MSFMVHTKTHDFVCMQPTLLNLVSPNSTAHNTMSYRCFRFQKVQVPGGGWRTSFTARVDLFREEWFHLDGTNGSDVQLLRVPKLDFQAVFEGDLSSLDNETAPSMDAIKVQQTRAGINSCAGRIARATRDDRCNGYYIFPSTIALCNTHRTNVETVSFSIIPQTL